MNYLRSGPCLALLLVCLLPAVVRAQAPEVELPVASGSEDASRPLPARNPERSGKKPLAPSNSRASGQSAGTSGWWTTAAGLMVVVGLMLGGVRLFKKHLPGAARFLPPQAVQVLGKRPLDYKQMIYLLRCGSKILVVGASPQGLVTLGEITEPVEVDYLAGLCQAQDQQSVGESFSQLFRQFRPEPSAMESPDQESAEVDLPPVVAHERVRSGEARFGRMSSSRGPIEAEEQHA